MSERKRTIEWQDPSTGLAYGRGRGGLEWMQAIASGAIPQAPISETLRFWLVAVEEGFARFEGSPDESLCNPMGPVHGGVAATLLDSAMGCAVMTTLDAGTAYTTAQLGVHLVRPLTPKTERCVVEGRVLHRGRSLATAEARLLDDRGALVAHGTTTCAIFPR
ncbi:MAG: PaaI family thioesterase [Polyangiaceae bacterium]